MKIDILIVLFFCSLFIIGCNTNPKNMEFDASPRKYERKITLDPVDTIRIAIGQSTNVFSHYISKTTVSGNDYLGVVNENTNNLEFYALSSKAENFSIKFQQEGPNGVKTIKSFEILDDSTILIGGSYRREMYICDYSGNVLKRINSVKKERNDGKPFVQIYSTNRPLIYRKQTESFLTFAIADQDYYAPGLWSGTYFLELAKDENREMKHAFNLPEHLSNLVYGAYFSHCSHAFIEPNKAVISMPFLNVLMVYNFDEETITYVEAGHNKFGDVLPLNRPNPSLDEKEYVENNSYREIVFDKETGYLYRLAYEGVDYKDLSGNSRTWDNKIPSIIILNSELKKVGEYELPVNQIYTRMLFTYQGKLYVSINHPDNYPSEDELIFIGLKPVDVNK